MRLLTLGSSHPLSLYQGPRSSRMRSGFTHNCAERYVDCFTVTPCVSHYAQRIATHPRRPRPPIFFTLRRLNSPRIAIEQRGTARVKTLKLMGTALYASCSKVRPVCSRDLRPLFVNCAASPSPLPAPPPSQIQMFRFLSFQKDACTALVCFFD